MKHVGFYLLLFNWMHLGPCHRYERILASTRTVSGRDSFQSRHEAVMKLSIEPLSCASTRESLNASQVRSRLSTVQIKPSQSKSDAEGDHHLWSSLSRTLTNSSPNCRYRSKSFQIGNASELQKPILTKLQRIRGTILPNCKPNREQPNRYAKSLQKPNRMAKLARQICLSRFDSCLISTWSCSLE